MLKLENIHKAFDDFNIQNVNFSVEQGDYFVILGKSGTGKTLILEMIAGLLMPDKGKIWLERKDITKAKVKDRDVGLVFQDYAIFPHKTVFKNIAYPIKGEKRLKERVLSLAKQTGVEHLMHRFPSTLSGGEIQRTVLARTLAAEPKVLLLDEPLTSLDVQFKKELQGLLRELNRQGKTIVHVTHDYEEALSLANKVAVMHEGNIVQQGKVNDVFRKPANKFIADFVGIRNFFYARSLSNSNMTHNVAIINDKVSVAFLNQVVNGEGCIITIDARHVILSPHKLDSTALNNYKGEIIDIIPSINGLEVIIDIGVEIAAIITSASYQRFHLGKGKEVWVSFKASAVTARDL